MKPIVALLTLALVSCASAPMPGAAPDWTAIPAGVVESFCAKLRAEGISAEAPIAVVKETQPLVTAATLRSLAQAYGRGGSVMPLAASAEWTPMPVTIAGGSCRWNPVDSVDADRSGDVMIAQFSNPISNPFGKREAGLFVRFTLGGHDAQWYWIPIAERKGQWLVGYVVPLALRE